MAIGSQKPDTITITFEAATTLNYGASGGSGFSSSFSTGGKKEGTLQVDVTAIGGTAPNLIIEVQTSYDNNEWFYCNTLTEKDTVGSLTRLTAPTTEAKILAAGNHMCWIDRLSNYIKLVYTIGGTSTPTFTLSAKATLF
jgi:hypothetical protein